MHENLPDPIRAAMEQRSRHRSRLSTLMQQPGVWEEAAGVPERAEGEGQEAGASETEDEFQPYVSAQAPEVAGPAAAEERPEMTGPPLPPPELSPSPPEESAPERADLAGGVIGDVVVDVDEAVETA